jgi:YHS domain-containing protein
MKSFISILSFLIASTALIAKVSNDQHEVSPKVCQSEFSLKKQLILEGYDVVSYQQASGPKKGKRANSAEYKGVLYYFTSEANKTIFLADPERYEPLYGGWCAYAMLEGDKTNVDPETYKIVDGHLLVFYNGVWGNTYELWNKMLEGKVTDTGLIGRADRAWESILK